MPIVTEANAAENAVAVMVEGRFDSTCHGDFRRAFLSCDATTRFTIDLQKASFMDSAALGLLLLLREKVGGDASRVEIINAHGQPREVLNVANFGQLFRVT